MPVSDVSWETFVTNTGGQAEIDRCTGGLTDMTTFTGNNWEGGRYFGLHRHCGGWSALALSTGQIVTIDNVRYQVIGATAIPRPGYNAPGLPFVSWNASYDQVETLGGDAYIQSCREDKNQGTRVVALVQI
ncbi:hypothetical protein PYV02_01480 [Leifsonia sp. H3M29-4]|uniref:hypothetical protein n=1 Tax=Salinibacterium metalliresistens TaxID=3031321 RepID=UPI0023DBAF04|nr:hypothetical protein [Salinibacterium metalliresistens]MDF1477750.1 hypothetical protein [Salinibacterium metalliresistens]